MVGQTQQAPYGTALSLAGDFQADAGAAAVLGNEGDASRFQGGLDFLQVRRVDAAAALEPADGVGGDTCQLRQIADPQAEGRPSHFHLRWHQHVGKPLVKLRHRVDFTPEQD